MVDQKQNWSKNWKQSKNPSKQRKYTRNAPQHVKDKLLSTRLHPEIREELGTKTLPIVIGDRVKAMVGDQKGQEGIVTRIDRENQQIYINQINRNRQDGTQISIPHPPSNLRIEALNIEDLTRIDKYEDVNVDKIEVDEDEVEEALEEEEQDEMMQQMQQGETDHLGEDEEETDQEDEEEIEEETEETEEKESDELEEEIEEELEEIEDEIEKSQEETENKGEKQ